MKLLIAAGTAALVLTSSASATDLSQYVNALTARATYSYGMDIDNSPAEFDFSELSITALLSNPVSLGGDWSAVSYLDFRASRINFDGNPLIGTFADDIESDLFHVGVPFAIYNSSAGSRWTYGAWVSPSISSDFDHIDSDDFFLDAAVAVGYQVNDCFTIGVGVYASDMTKDLSVIPGIGFAWTPTEDWLITYYGPRFIARRNINDRNKIGFEVAYNGGNWNIDSRNTSVKLNYSSWRSGIFYRYNITGQLWLEAAAGFTFANELNFQTRDGVDIFPTRLGDSGAAPYATLGLSVARW